ncbi:hypothetical protein [Algivirga pacifica]|uniref:hypothetical protein n=1 Tax=Algivirga pacifica TaxID=1162670 RepID=UPI0031F1C170
MSTIHHTYAQQKEKDQYTMIRKVVSDINMRLYVSSNEEIILPSEEDKRIYYVNVIFDEKNKTLYVRYFDVEKADYAYYPLTVYLEEENHFFLLKEKGAFTIHTETGGQVVTRGGEEVSKTCLIRFKTGKVGKFLSGEVVDQLNIIQELYEQVGREGEELSSEDD